MLEEVVILLVFQLGKFVQVLALKAVLMCKSPRLDKGFLDHGRGRGGLLGDDAMLAENIVPAGKSVRV